MASLFIDRLGKLLHKEGTAQPSDVPASEETAAAVSGEGVPEVTPPEESPAPAEPVGQAALTGEAVPESPDEAPVLASSDAPVPDGPPADEPPASDARVTTDARPAVDARPAADTAEEVCVRCGRCVEVCPQGLMPCYLYEFARLHLSEECRRLHVYDCTGCGDCTAVCPAGRSLAAQIRPAARTTGVADADDEDILRIFQRSGRHLPWKNRNEPQ